MSLSLGVFHTRLIPISFGYPYVSRQLVALACPQRGGQPALLSVADARLSAVVSAASRAHPALSSPQDPSGLDAGVLGRPDGARRHRHLRHRADPSDTGRSQPATDWPQRPLQSSLDRRRETVSLIEPVGADRGVGM